MKELPSTQTYCIDNYKKLPIPAAVIAENQTHGKGRSHSNWVSTEGSLTFSVVLSMPNHLTNTAIITSNVIRKVLEEYEVKNVRIKWPNDIYVLSGSEEYKVGGVLVNMIGKADSTIEDSLFISVIGIGLNVYSGGSHNIKYKNIEELSGIRIDKEELFLKLVERVQKVFTIESRHSSYCQWSNYFPYTYVLYENRPCPILRIEDDLYIEDCGQSLKLSANEYSYNRHSNIVHRKV